MQSIKSILMRRDGLTEAAALKAIDEATAHLYDAMAAKDFETADDICHLHFGLEPDYLEDLIHETVMAR